MMVKLHVSQRSNFYAGPESWKYDVYSVHRYCGRKCVAFSTLFLLLFGNCFLIEKGLNFTLDNLTAASMTPFHAVILFNCS